MKVVHVLEELWLLHEFLKGLTVVTADAFLAQRGVLFILVGIAGDERHHVPALLLGHLRPAVDRVDVEAAVSVRAQEEWILPLEVELIPVRIF